VFTFYIQKSLAGKTTLDGSSFSENYEQVVLSENGIPKADKSSTSLFGVALNLDNYFGRKRMVGIRTGLQLDFISFDVTESSFGIDYRAKESRGNYLYRRRLSINEPVTESEKFQV